MFSSGPNFTKLKTNLRLAMARLKILEKKKAELAEKSRREIAEFIKDGKVERAKIRVEYIIREDYLVEAMEIVEMYCDLLLARFGLITNMKDLDDGIAEAVSSLIWVAPRLQSDCAELKIISDLLTAKYGVPYAEQCRAESVESLNDRLKHKLSIASPPKILVEKYLIEIAHSFKVPYEPDQQVMEQDKDAVLIDLSDRNNLGGGSAMPHPPGFFGYPPPPAMPNLPDFYQDPSKANALDGPTAPPPAFSYNIPPYAENKDLNTQFMDSLPSYDNIFPDLNKIKEAEGNEKSLHDDNNLENTDEFPKPLPRSKVNNSDFDPNGLPSVPSDEKSDNVSEVDFDDLNKRFEALKKRH